jgi:hypothetical protein
MEVLGAVSFHIFEGKGWICCDRCGKETTVTTMSYFNTETVCMVCKDKERAHPKYKAALDADHQAVLRGDFNFPGIGKPDDL